MSSSVRFYRSFSINPAYNLATEQFLFENKKPAESIIFLWQNDNTVVVGRYQNVFEEVDTAYAEEINAKIVRRMTGGGAVYHDLGNLNYSFIVNNDNELESCNDILMNAFNALGLNAQFEGRNDIVIDGAKISGCASCRENGKILHHGTLLINTDISVLKRVLTRNNKISSNSVKSKIRRVVNLSGFINKIDIETVIKAICGNERPLEPKPNLRIINELRQRRYDNSEWTYGFPPKYSYKNSLRYETGQICVNVNIQDNQIADVKFSGDFITLKDIKELEQALINQSVSESLKNFLDEYGNDFILGVQGRDLTLLFSKFK